MIKVCKFGGTSMADGMTIARVAQIVRSDPARRYIVVSAPGKRYGGDEKVTDLLYAAHRSLMCTGTCDFQRIRRRFLGIAGELGMKEDFDVESFLSCVEREIKERRREAFTASRGEYLAARLTAAYLNLPFVDAEELIRFHEQGELDGEETERRLREALSGVERAVLPGFYGSGPGGVYTFPRGGSDVTGALVARAVGADLYENWTDVSGFLAADPRIAENPHQIPRLTFDELFALSRMGASVLHPDSVAPVRERGIPVCVRNTFRPHEAGTLILPSAEPDGPITGIAGGKDYLLVRGEKEALRERISECVCAAAGVGSTALIFKERRTAPVCTKNFEAEPIALVAAVGRGMRSAAVPARILKAAAQAGVSVRAVIRASEEEFFFCTEREDFERAVRAVYDEFFRA